MLRGTFNAGPLVATSGLVTACSSDAFQAQSSQSIGFEQIVYIYNQLEQFRIDEEAHEPANGRQTRPQPTPVLGV